MATQNDSPAAKLVVRKATKYYGSRNAPLHALGALDLEVEPGQFVSILGPSGCGKTTLLWSMAGLHALTEGTISLGDEQIVKPHPQIGMVFQEANLLPWRRLMENILLPFEIKKQEPDMDWIRHLLDRVNLTGFDHHFPRELSGGMQQRAAIVRALSFKPSVLLMDEPFSALDAFTRDEMNLLLEEVWLETRKTVVFITHNIAEAIFLSDKIFVMSPRPGRVARVFDVDYERPRPLEITTEESFFKLSNEIKAEIEGLKLPNGAANVPNRTA